MRVVAFEDELADVLPSDLPNRDLVIEKSSEHLRLVSLANESMNLTRISGDREAAVKHVLDSVMPWHLFSGAPAILDAGTGAGFPGIPLSLVLPRTRFLLCESIGKKARFVDHVVETLELPNVEVLAERAEQVAFSHRSQLITARAVAPLHRLVQTFAPSLSSGARLLLYKGPDIEQEIRELNSRRVHGEVLLRYELPEGYGLRTLVSLAAQTRVPRTAS